MKVRLIPLVIAVVLPCLAYYFYLSPTTTTVSGLEARVALASTEADTIAAGSMIRPRIERERAQIAARLVRVKVLTLPQAETRFLSDIASLARADGVTLVSVAAKGKPVPFGSAAQPRGAQVGPLPSNATPLPALASAGANVPASTLGMQLLADGVTLERTVTVSGSLVGVVRFVDGIGSLATPVSLGNITLAQGDTLRATFDCQVVVVQAAELRDAKRANLRGTPGLAQGRTS